jgi:hypothetical protein
MYENDNVLIFEIGSNLYELLEFVNVFGCRFPGLVDNGYVYGTYRVPHPEAPYPQDYVIDQEGRIAYWSVEYDPQEVIRVIDRLLEQGSNLSVALQPINPPIVIPAGGGSFDYNIAATNSGTSPLSFDVWCMVTLPNGSPYGPVLGPVNVTLPAGITIDRDRTQVVPGSAPAGEYIYNAYVGTYPNVTLDSDSFPFTKTGVAESQPPYTEWRNTGNPFEETAGSVEDIPRDHLFLHSHPNPFNPATSISFQLPEACWVRLDVFDICGRLTESLLQGFRKAGTYEVTFDASDLTSGIYFYRIEAGDFTAVKKMILMK